MPHYTSTPAKTPRARKKPTLDSLIAKYTTLWARTPIRNPQMPVYQDILKELHAQKELGFPFEESAETFSERVSRAKDEQSRALYQTALADVQKAM